MPLEVGSVVVTRSLVVTMTPCIRPQLETASRGYQQNLWLFGEEKYILEVGAMNAFFVFEDSKTLDW
jgi:branched-chain amino acid aminotransferase